MTPPSGMTNARARSVSIALPVAARRAARDRRDVPRAGGRSTSRPVEGLRSRRASRVRRNRAAATPTPPRFGGPRAKRAHRVRGRRGRAKGAAAAAHDGAPYASALARATTMAREAEARAEMEMAAGGARRPRRTRPLQSGGVSSSPTAHPVCACGPRSRLRFSTLYAPLRGGDAPCARDAAATSTRTRPRRRRRGSRRRRARRRRRGRAGGVLMASREARARPPAHDELADQAEPSRTRYLRVFAGTSDDLRATSGHRAKRRVDVVSSCAPQRRGAGPPYGGSAAALVQLGADARRHGPRRSPGRRRRTRAREHGGVGGHEVRALHDGAGGLHAHGGGRRRDGGGGRDAEGKRRRREAETFRRESLVLQQRAPRCDGALRRTRAAR